MFLCPTHHIQLMEIASVRQLCHNIAFALLLCYATKPLSSLFARSFSCFMTMAYKLKYVPFY